MTTKTGKIILVLPLLLALTACTTVFPSKQACQKEQAAMNGGIAGAIGGSAFGNGWGTLATTLVAGLVGQQAGIALQSHVSEGKPDDVRPYESTWYDDCEPVQ